MVGKRRGKRKGRKLWCSEKGGGWGWQDLWSCLSDIKAQAVWGSWALTLKSWGGGGEMKGLCYSPSEKRIDITNSTICAAHILHHCHSTVMIYHHVLCALYVSLTIMPVCHSWIYEHSRCVHAHKEKKNKHIHLWHLSWKPNINITDSLQITLLPRLR